MTDSKFTEIHFEDQGQDFWFWVVNKDGYVVDSQPLQYSVWAGTRVDLECLEVGARPTIMSRFETDGECTQLNYAVTDVKAPKERFPFWDEDPDGYVADGMALAS